MQWSWILKCLPLSSFSYFIKMSQNLLRLHIISIYFLMYALHLYPTSLRRGSSNGTWLDALKKYGNQMSMKNIRWKICVSLSCVIIAVNQCTKLFKLLLQLLDAMTYRDICDKLCCRGQKILLFNFCLKHRVELGKHRREISLSISSMMLHVIYCREKEKHFYIWHLICFRVPNDRSQHCYHFFVHPSLFDALPLTPKDIVGKN